MIAIPRLRAFGAPLGMTKAIGHASAFAGSDSGLSAPVITATVSLMLISFGFSTGNALAQPRDVNPVRDLEDVWHVVRDQHHRQPAVSYTADQVEHHVALLDA